ncbi:hypothetical protein AVEN_56073-1 [Araneus ventricosus]|uniref:Uncharacterized protein n=1 Tax=Araneus ventricosus TaxID=182803 RepID=A0A4Y2WMZ9_ARAVE|nr:hypothetical protein AVEN_56073-1 [Araneus ventricosus]
MNPVITLNPTTPETSVKQPHSSNTFWIHFNFRKKTVFENDLMHIRYETDRPTRIGVCARNASSAKNRAFSKPVDTNRRVCKERIVCKSRLFLNRSAKIGVCASSLRSVRHLCRLREAQCLSGLLECPLAAPASRLPERKCAMA